MKHVKIIFLLIAFCVVNMQKAFSQSDASESSKVFVINDSTKLYWAEEYTTDFMYLSGFSLRDSSERRIFHIRMINGADDSTYVNSQWGNFVQSESFRDNAYCLSLTNFSSTNQTLQRKKFNYDTKTWDICSFYNDGLYFSGTAFDAKRTAIYELSDDVSHSEDKFMIKLIFFILVFTAFAVTVPIWEDFAWVWLLVGFLISLCSTVFIDLSIVSQLFLPLLCLSATAFLFKIPQYSGTIRTVGQLILAGVIIVFFGLKQFVCVDDTIRLSDGYELNLTWKRGSCLIKRLYVKSMLSNLVPVAVNANGEEYTLYISKYEFSGGNYSVVSDEALSWLFGLCKDPLYNFSFRESQILMEYLNLLTGVRFDFMSYQEWASITKDKNHSPNDLDYCKVTKGDVSDDGLVNILGNMPEYTYSYYSGNYRVGMAADTLVQSYTNVLVAGSAFECSDSLNLSIVNKNVRNGLVGFRLVFRPDDIGARKFSVKGFLRSDKVSTGLPKKISLVSVDGLRVEELANYESFEELLIEGRLADRKFEAVDLSDNKVFYYDQPQGLEYYDFVPEFTFMNTKTPCR